MMTPKEIALVVSAFDCGAAIESREKTLGDWVDDPSPAWNFEAMQYRVKPKEIEAWGVVSSGELYRVCHDKILAEEWAGYKDTVIRLIPDPNWSHANANTTTI